MRETLAEKGLGALRKAGGVFGRRIPAMIGKFTAGTAGSGGALAIPMGVWAAGDVLDTAAEAITGRGILTTLKIQIVFLLLIVSSIGIKEVSNV